MPFIREVKIIFEFDSTNDAMIQYASNFEGKIDYELLAKFCFPGMLSPKIIDSSLDGEAEKTIVTLMVESQFPPQEIDHDRFPKLPLP